MEILIENMQNKIEVSDEIYSLINRTVDLSLQLEDFKIPSEISVLLVDDEAIREINLEHRKIDKSTDVLSFPMVEMVEGKVQSDNGDYNLDEELLLLGDIVLSMETAAKQADEYGHSFERELAFLVTHGVFHLLGYDHMEKDQEKRMFDRQEAVLKQMGLARE